MKKVFLTAVSMLAGVALLSAATMPESGKTYTVTNVAANLNASLSSDGAKLVINTPNASDANQQFLFTELSDGKWSIKAANEKYVGTNVGNSEKWNIKFYDADTDTKAQYKIVDNGTNLSLNFVGGDNPGKGWGVDNTTEGSTIYTDKAGEDKYRWTLTEVPTIEATGVTLSENTLSLKIFESAQLTATLEPEGASGKVEWSSSDATVAAVSSAGLVYGLSAGTATITVTVGEHTATCEVTVSTEVMEKHPGEVDFAKINELYNGNFEDAGLEQSHPSEYDWSGVEDVMNATVIPHWKVDGGGPYNVCIGVGGDDGNRYVRFFGRNDNGWAKGVISQDVTVAPGKEHMLMYEYRLVHNYRPAFVTVENIDVNGNVVGEALYNQEFTEQNASMEKADAKFTPTTGFVRLTVGLNNYWSNPNNGEKEARFANFCLASVDNIKTTGVESIEEAEEADCEVEYYTLTGLKVVNPAAGIYIRKQGNKVAKVAIK